MPQFLKDNGEILVDLGYTVLPIKPGSKRPDIKNWPNHKTTKADVVAWYSNGRSQHGVGINARNTPAIDVDVLDPEVAGAMADAIDAIFPGHSLLIRTGMAPKFLIPFRSDEPFRKLISQTYTDGTHEHKVEILGDGQQFVAYAVHPDTGHPYAWFDGLSDQGIREVARDELPALNRDDAKRVIEAFELLAVERVSVGAWSLKAGAVPLDAADNARVHGDPFAQHSAPTNLSLAGVNWLIAQESPEDYEPWIDVGMRLHHQFEGSDEGLSVWDSWSTVGTTYARESCEEHWASFGNGSHVPRTLRGLLDKHGQPPAEPKTLEGNEFVQAAQFASEQRTEWLVKKVLPKRALTIIYGEPGSGKSFFALDMVACVARGLQWRGLRTKQCTVAYVAAEGVAGFGNRLKAYSEGHDVDLSVLPVFVRGGQLTLKEQAVAVVDAVMKLPNLGIVVIDTLAAVTPGANENTSEDMGAAIERANFIIETTGAAVILIHHSTKDGGALRGWSGLLGAADSTIKIERKDAKRTAYVEKMKEGDDSGKYPFKLRIVDLGVDEDGDPVTSCVIEESEEIAEKSTVKKERKPRSGDFETSDNYAPARHFLQVIEELVGLGGANIDETDIIAAIQSDEKANPTGQEDTPAVRSIKRTLHTLGLKGKIKKEGRWIRLCES